MMSCAPVVGDTARKYTSTSCGAVPAGMNTSAYSVREPFGAMMPVLVTTELEASRNVTVKPDGKDTEGEKTDVLLACRMNESGVALVFCISSSMRTVVPVLPDAVVTGEASGPAPAPSPL